MNYLLVLYSIQIHTNVTYSGKYITSTKTDYKSVIYIKAARNTPKIKIQDILVITDFPFQSTRIHTK